MCKCSSPAECFLYFTDVTCSASDAYLLLSKMSVAATLQNATLTVCISVNYSFSTTAIVDFVASARSLD